MKPLSPWMFVAAMLSLATALPALTFAQEKGDASETPRAALSLTFPGGTLADYGAAIQEAAGWANIVMDPRASEVRLPKCELRGVTVKSALEAAAAMVEQRDGQVTIGVSVIHQAGFAPVNTVSVYFAKPLPVESPSSASDRFTVLSIREIVSPPSGASASFLKPEAVLTAIETAVGLATSRLKAVVKYHPDTQLVIVQGSQSQVSLVQQIVEQIRQDVRARGGRSSDARDGGKAIASIEERIAGAERELARLRAELAERQDPNDKGKNGSAR
jgi:uncharacterized small protein (DUF1192 family)